MMMCATMTIPMPPLLSAGMPLEGPIWPVFAPGGAFPGRVSREGLNLDFTKSPKLSLCARGRAYRGFQKAKTLPPSLLGSKTLFNSPSTLPEPSLGFPNPPCLSTPVEPEP